MIDKPNVVAHADPVWIGKADSLIVADLSGSDLPGRWEQLPAKGLGRGGFQVCCIPFFADGLALGDEVATAAGPDGDLVVASVVVPSNHTALRVAFLAAAQGEELAGRVIGAAAAAGCLVERYSRRYLAVDVVARSPELAGLTRLLDPLQDQGLVEYELSR